MWRPPVGGGGQLCRTRSAGVGQPDIGVLYTSVSGPTLVSGSFIVSGWHQCRAADTGIRLSNTSISHPTLVSGSLISMTGRSGAIRILHPDKNVSIPVWLKMSNSSPARVNIGTKNNNWFFSTKIYLFKLPGMSRNAEIYIFGEGGLYAWHW